jgi:osmotically-inducible protein OsmY
MNTRRFLLRSSLAALVIFSGEATATLGQNNSPSASKTTAGGAAGRPETAVLNALRSHPMTAPYPIRATWRNGALVLSGVVGTKLVHDVAVRLAIDSGVPVRDNLVIDTAAADLAAQSAALAAQGAFAGSPALSASTMYVYPPPLMGRLDDPFFGFVPPLVSFPPWWRRRVEGTPIARARIPSADGGLASVAAPSAALPEGARADGGRPTADEPVKGQVEITVDAAGQVFLRGVVASEEVGREIIETARSVPGVTRVENQLQVVPRRAEAEEIPPPPTPVPVAPVQAPERPAQPQPDRQPPAPASPEPAIVPVRPRPADTEPAGLDAKALTRRVVDSLQRRKAASTLPVKVRSSDGAVTLTGRVPSVYEAMLVYRATEQTPGVQSVVDRLEFAVPDDDHPNPLVRKGRPEDLEPYLASQIRRHVGDLAHIDRIHARGDVLEVRGSVMNARDRDRLFAILRSIPVLRGFRLEPEFAVE